MKTKTIPARIRARLLSDDDMWKKITMITSEGREDYFFIQNVNFQGFFSKNILQKWEYADILKREIFFTHHLNDNGWMSFVSRESYAFALKTNELFTFWRHLFHKIFTSNDWLYCRMRSIPVITSISLYNILTSMCSLLNNSVEVISKQAAIIVSHYPTFLIIAPDILDPQINQHQWLIPPSLWSSFSFSLFTMLSVALLSINSSLLFFSWLGKGHHWVFTSTRTLSSYHSSRLASYDSKVNWAFLGLLNSTIICQRSWRVSFFIRACAF